MTLLEKYLSGQTETVYDEIYSLGSKVFEPVYFQQVDDVLTETFKRVQFNLSVIHEKLRAFGYKFLADEYDDEDKPFVAETGNSEKLILEFEQKVSPYYIPLSLKYFFKFIRTCDFTWNWNQEPIIPWEGADPIVVPSIKFLLECFVSDYCNGVIPISSDNLHKDNISGDCYYLELGESPIVDSTISGYGLKFIEYLRLTVSNCGFTSANECDSDSLKDFCRSVQPSLLPI